MCEFISGFGPINHRVWFCREKPTGFDIFVELTFYAVCLGRKWNKMIRKRSSSYNMRALYRLLAINPSLCIDDDDGQNLGTAVI